MFVLELDMNCTVTWTAALWLRWSYVSGNREKCDECRKLSKFDYSFAYKGKNSREILLYYIILQLLRQMFRESVIEI